METEDIKGIRSALILVAAVLQIFVLAAMIFGADCIKTNLILNLECIILWICLVLENPFWRRDEKNES